MNAVDVLKYGHLTVLQAVDGLPEAAWETPGVCGVWSVRQILAHLASYEHWLVDVLTSLGDGGPTPTLDHLFEVGPAAFNDLEVAARDNLSPAATLAEYTTMAEQAQAMARALPAARFCQVGTLPWYGAAYDLDDFLVYTFYGHKREHCAQIAVYRDQLKAQAG